MQAIDVDLEEYIILENEQEEGILYAVRNELWDKVLDHRTSEYNIQTDSFFLVDCCKLHFNVSTEIYSLTDKLVKVDSVFLRYVSIRVPITEA